MSQFPLGLLILCVSVLLLNSGTQAEQCRLIAQGPNGHTGIDFPSTPTGTGFSPPTNTSGPNSSVINTTAPFLYGQDIIRGVNLGGWFVLEPWITPSIFENTNNTNIIDEYTFGQMQNRTVARNVLENHWDTWITEDDFKAMSAAGLNHVRIPVGYWSVPLTSADTNYSTSVAPYIQGAWPHLLRALNWAKSHSIHVIIDLHGAPGSQNGYDNSGQRTSNPVWAQNPANVSLTLDVLKFIIENAGGLIDVIELLNEPAGFMGDAFAQVVRQFWQDGYDEVRAVAGPDLKVMIGDAFLGVQSWSGFLTYPSAQGVMMDFHQYQIFSDDQLSRSFDQHISFACGLIPDLVSFSTSNIWTVMGEWSNAPTDCAKWLNGRGVGARWDGTWPGSAGQVLGSCDGWTGNYTEFSSDYKAFLRKYWEAQTEIGERVQGWVFWTWKAEIADEWSYMKGLEGGWIPQDPTHRLYPNICG